ncbi:hypothetical protein DDE82_002863 [Stemphylium lycopersici]|nr:hypothetical protein DDE82_002863 [Stemphylium lycopersici]
MAEILGVISGLYTAGQALHKFAQQIHRWRRLSDRLFDIREGLEFAKLTLDSWQCRYDINGYRPDVHMRILFGKEGNERILATLGTIKIITKTINSDVSRIRGLTLKVQSVRPYYEDSRDTADEERVRECLRRIQRNNTWSRKFVLSVLGKADDLEMRLERLHRKLTMLERFADYFLEKEHPDVFSEIKRLPGRRVIIKVGDGRMDAMQKKILDARAAQKDAQLLHRASSQDNRIHIGISVPKIHPRDFAFLLSLRAHTHEVLVQPKKIKSFNDPHRVSKNFEAAISALVKKTHNDCFLMPSLSTSAGFQISRPATNLLSDLEYKDSLSTIIRNQSANLSSQWLYSQDQSAIASGIAQGCFRLIGSQWLSFLDCANVRWRRTNDGRWTSMLTAVPGPSSTTRALERCYIANRQRRNERDLSKHIHIFRIGIVLAELALRSPISYIDFDSATNTTRLYVKDGEEVGANEIAAQVELKSNIFLGNMVFFCLNVLQDDRAMSEGNIEGGYFQEVIKQAEELDRFIGADRRRGDLSLGVSPVGSGANTPRSAGCGYRY